jgi:hypothetical protein
MTCLALRQPGTHFTSLVREISLQLDHLSEQAASLVELAFADVRFGQQQQRFLEKRCIAEVDGVLKGVDALGSPVGEG